MRALLVLLVIVWTATAAAAQGLPGGCVQRGDLLLCDPGPYIDIMPRMTLPTVTPAHVDSFFLRALITGVGATAGGDIYTTGVAIGALPKAREKNLALRWSMTSPAGLGLVKGAIAVGQVQGLVWLHTRSKIATYLIGGGTIALNVYAIKHNAALVGPR